MIEISVKQDICADLKAFWSYVVDDNENNFGKWGFLVPTTNQWKLVET